MQSSRINIRNVMLPLAACALALPATFGLVGCGAEEEAQEVRQQAPAPPPPIERPRTASVEQLMEQLGIDRRIALRDEHAPEREPQRVAVLQFFDAIVRGNADSLSRMLSMPDRLELRRMIESDQWKQTIDGIEMVEVFVGRAPAPFETTAALAVFYVEDSFQPQLWLMHGSRDDFEFEAVATPPNIMDRLYGAYGPDWIARWFEIIEEEMRLAEQPDEEIRIPRRNVGADPGGGAGGGPGPSPGGPGGPMPITPPDGPLPEIPPPPDPTG